MANASMSRESRGSQPGTSGLQSRAPPRFQAPPMSRGANILRLALARNNVSVVSDTEASRNSMYTEDTADTNFEESDEDFLYEDIPQHDVEVMMADGLVVNETGTTVTVQYIEEVKF